MVGSEIFMHRIEILCCTWRMAGRENVRVISQADVCDAASHREIAQERMIRKEFSPLDEVHDDPSKAEKWPA
jgi:hypothetical protein